VNIACSYASLLPEVDSTVLLAWHHLVQFKCRGLVNIACSYASLLPEVDSTVLLAWHHLVQFKCRGLVNIACSYASLHRLSGSNLIPELKIKSIMYSIL
jgi:hypothetical protein